MVDALTADGHIPWIVVFAVARYTLVYTAGTLLVAIAIFRGSEIH